MSSTYTSNNNLRCLVIAPTEILAHQIYRQFKRFAKGLNIVCNLLTKSEIDNNNNDKKIKTLQEYHVIISIPKLLVKIIKKKKIYLTS